MAKIVTTYEDGWPMMAPLGKKESARLAENLLPGEQVVGQVIGNFGQVVVATTSKVVIVKSGLMSGQTFGGKATAFDYSNLVGVEVRTGLIQGEFEILAAGLENNQRSNVNAKVNMAEQPNGVVFTKSDKDAFNAMAAKIRERASAAHVVHAAPAAISVADELVKFAALREQGILSEDEFAAKKAQLLK